MRARLNNGELCENLATMDATMPSLATCVTIDISSRTTALDLALPPPLKRPLSILQAFANRKSGGIFARSASTENRSNFSRSLDHFTF